MRTYYLDSDFRVHLDGGEGMTPWVDEDGFFNDKVRTFVEGFRVIPKEMVWVDPRGTRYEGFMIAACVDYTTLDKAQTDQGEMRTVMDKVSELLDDAQASKVVELYKPYPKDGSLVKVGRRINWNGVLLRAKVDLWATDENNPDNAPGLWEKIAYRDGYRVLSEPITASNPVQPGEKCWEGDVLYECIYHVVCTYRPSEYAAAWKVVEV